jgi:hypothetical protein
MNLKLQNELKCHLLDGDTSIAIMHSRITIFTRIPIDHLQYQKIIMVLH